MLGLVLVTLVLSPSLNRASLRAPRVDRHFFGFLTALGTFCSCHSRIPSGLVLFLSLGTDIVQPATIFAKLELGRKRGREKMASFLSQGTRMSLCLFVATLARMANGHEHHGDSKIPEGQTISLEPLVSIESGPSWDKRGKN